MFPADSTDNGQEAAEDLVCAHLPYQHHWDGAAFPQPGTQLGVGRAHPRIMPPPCGCGAQSAATSAHGAQGGGPSGGLPCLPDSCPCHGRLFQMNVGPPKKLEELDPETREYWRLLRKHNIWRHNRLSKNQKF